MEAQGLVLIVVAVAVVAYIVPYLHKRRQTLSDARIEERYSEDLRMIAPVDEPAADGFSESHRAVFENRNEVTMATSETTDTATTVRSLARERARRRARITRREANRTRGFVGVGIIGGLMVLLWILRLSSGLPLWAPIAMTVVAAIYGAGFAYLLREMAKASESDLGAIKELTEQLTQARGANREISRRRERAAQARTVSGASRRREAAAAQEVEKPVDAMSAHTERGRPRKDTSRVARSAQSDTTTVSGARPVVSTRKVSESGVPSYTLKPTAIERREIAPYQAPAADEAPVPYRPKALGEKVAAPADAAEASASVSAPSADSLAGGSALDALLARRRA